MHLALGNFPKHKLRDREAMEHLLTIRKDRLSAKNRYQKIDSCKSSPGIPTGTTMVCVCVCMCVYGVNNK